MSGAGTMAAGSANRPKHLFIVSVATGYGGAERSIEIIARHLPEEIRTSIYAAHPEHIARLDAVARTRSNLRIRRLSARPSLLARQRAALSLLVDFKRHSPDAVIVNTHASALLCAMVAGRAPQLAECAALFVRDFLWQDLDYIFSRLRASRVFVPNEVVAERPGYLWPFHLGPNGRTATAVPDMVDLPAPAAYAHRGPLLHLATVNPFKGHAVLMLATERARAAGVAVAVHSAGQVADAGLHRRLVALGKTLGLEDGFELAGHASDPSRLLEQCRAVVVSTLSHSGGPETFGRTIIEAWAHGKPVIAFAAGAPARLISHDEDGLLVPEGDTEALAAAMTRLWTDPQLCRRLGEAGYRKAAARYEAGAVTQQLLGALGLG